MQPFMKNVSVEYADKAAPGGEIETEMIGINDAISTLQEDKATIDDVKALIESGTVSNAKPIYFHPLSIQSTTGKYRLSCIILNNSPTPFTLDTFKEFVDSLDVPAGDDARVIVSGAYFDSTRGLYTCSVLFTNGSSYGLAGIDSTGSIMPLFASVAWGTIFKDNPSVYDAVNRIN